MNILEEIAEKRKVSIAGKKELVSPETVMRQARESAAQELLQHGSFSFPFYRNLQGGIHFICEVKKASPSKGIISEDFPYLQQAMAYDEGGASAISVLTEPEYFLGRDEYLKEISAKVSVPTLRKDFVVDEYQIYEAKTLGAAAVLLICSPLPEETLREYLSVCHELGLSALVEAHDAAEVEKALAAGAKIIGVNNRDLKDFTVDLNTSIRLRSMVPEDIVFVSESGIRTPEDIARLKENKVNAVLIGETLMRAGNVKEELKKLAGGKFD